MYLSVRKTSPSLPAKIVHARLQKIFFSFYENGRLGNTFAGRRKKKQIEQLRVFYLKLRDDIPPPYFSEDDRRG